MQENNEVIKIETDSAVQILETTFNCKFYFEFDGEFYSASVLPRKWKHFTTVYEKACNVWMGIFNGKKFATISDILLTFMDVLAEQKEWLEEFKFIDDHNFKIDTTKKYTIVDGMGIIYHDCNIDEEGAIIAKNGCPLNIGVLRNEQFKYLPQD